MHWLTAKPVRSNVSAARSMYGDFKGEAIAVELRRTGIFTGLTLPQAIHEEIALFRHETPCFGNFERKLEFLLGEHEEAECRLVDDAIRRETAVAPHLDHVTRICVTGLLRRRTIYAAPASQSTGRGVALRYR